MRMVDGYGVKFTSRTSWTIQIFRNGKAVGTAPVAWSKDFKPGRGDRASFLGVNFQNEAELMTKLSSRDAFVAALAVAHDYSTLPHSVKDITALFRVIPTGKRTGDKSIECKVLERVTATKSQSDAEG